ncbi:hypothetical protein AQJ23_44930 [Streptomyces antibioticus]|nr:hypothetical protein [Streptomyces antibioticus]KUN16542.1 hypothetical protein AQJ23_44930 [Streptomyces antibioticus]
MTSREEVYDSSDEYNRDDRIETIYQGWGAREMAERIVELEDELGADADGMCTGMHADVAEARAEVDRLTLLVAELQTELATSKRDADAGWTHAQRADDNAQEWATSWKFMFNDRTRILRYRLAWLSARRRAADEHNFGMEALELKNVELLRLREENEVLKRYGGEVP